MSVLIALVYTVLTMIFFSSFCYGIYCIFSEKEKRGIVIVGLLIASIVFVETYTNLTN